MIEAQSICAVKTVDKKEALNCVNEALQIQINNCQIKNQNIMSNKFIARIYEEKGIVLKEMA